MNYVAVQVMTGYESEVARRLYYKNKKFNLGLNILIPDRFVLKYGKNRRTDEYQNVMAGYIFVGFYGKIQDIYYHVKETFGVIRLLVKDGIYGLLTEKDIKRWVSALDEKVNICIEVDEDDMDLERFMRQIEKCREIVERKRNKVVRWFAMSLRVFKRVLVKVYQQVNPKYVLKRGEERFRQLCIERLSDDFDVFAAEE